ncbi:MAG: 5'-methylthioadenosine/adenosylhomocysteine nucleosidase [Clostridia bacterium]|nr:5'-methylthioadenosine/adenosylhomocysteine nucleosidase [Christensenellaceae bacterium]MBR6239464.1 5'-methylthioadenosine/adenosylhomocysteine nucleosidase [Clostridia bacterium]
MLYGIIAAMDSEIESLVENMTGREEIIRSGQTFHKGMIGKNGVVLLRCGIGKVSAAAGAQAMIDVFSPDMIINTGCAGAISEKLKIGDVVIADTCAEWDFYLGGLGLERGYLPDFGGVFMSADRELSSVISEFAETDSDVVRGLIVSGDQFVAEDSQRKIIKEAFPDALCAEMEGAAIGHVCIKNDLPFSIIRSISDTADGKSTVDFQMFSGMAGKKSAAMLIRMLNSMKGE